MHPCKVIFNVPVYSVLIFFLKCYKLCSHFDTDISKNFAIFEK